MIRWLLLLSLLLGLPGLAQDRAEELVKQLTPAEKFRLLGGIQDFFTHPIPRLGIPSLKMSDGPCGARCFGLSTAYPAPIALAASWDTALVKQAGEALGKDCRALGIHVLLTPGMNLARAPMNGRNFEYLGEDPYLAARMAVAMIQGIQSQGVMACAKHFIANQQEYGRMDHSSDLDERTMRELYLPAFEACVKEGRVATLMDAYNLVNGVYMTENARLNTEIAKREWGFDGFIMSDWGATHDGLKAALGGLDLEMPNAQFMTPEVLAQVPPEIIDDKVRRILRKALEFGFFERPQRDPSLPHFSQGRSVAVQGAREGMVLLKNRGVLPLARRGTILVVGPHAWPAVCGGGGSSETRPFRSTSFLEGISDAAGPGVKVLYSPEAVDIDAIVNASRFTTSPGGPPGLSAEYFPNQELKGPPGLTRVDPQVSFRYDAGGYAPGAPADHFSARWTGWFEPRETDDYRFYTSADDGVRLLVDGQRVIDDWQFHGETLMSGTVRLEAGKPHKVVLEYFEDGGSAGVRMGVTGSARPLDEVTRERARRADAVIACVGFTAQNEGEGYDRTFTLPPGQDAFLQELTGLNRNTVVVLTSGGNVAMEKWIDGAAALLHAWYPGQEGGTALGQLLFGDYSPSGKLPTSFEKRWEDNPAAPYYRPREGRRVAYGEGVFLGYRHYDRSEVKPRFPFGHGLSYTTFAYSGLEVTPRQVSFSVRNTGLRPGAEVAQLYIGDQHSRLPRPVKELKGFARVELQPGESRRITLPLEERSFAYWNEGWVIDPGEFAVLVGSSSADIRLQGVVRR